MPFKVATMTLKMVNGQLTVSPVKVTWQSTQCFSFSGNVPLQGNTVPLGPGIPFSFGPCQEGSGGAVRTSMMSFDQASIATWENPSFDQGAQVLLDMNVDNIGLQQLTVNLKCDVHPVRALTALAREVVEAGTAVLTSIVMFAVALLRLLSELILLPLRLTGVLSKAETSAASGSDDGGIDVQRPTDWSMAPATPNQPS